MLERWGCCSAVSGGQYLFLALWKAVALRKGWQFWCSTIDGSDDESWYSPIISDLPVTSTSPKRILPLRILDVQLGCQIYANYWSVSLAGRRFKRPWALPWCKRLCLGCHVVVHFGLMLSACSGGVPESFALSLLSSVFKWRMSGCLSLLQILHLIFSLHLLATWCSEKQRKHSHCSRIHCSVSPTVILSKAKHSKVLCPELLWNMQRFFLDGFVVSFDWALPKGGTASVFRTCPTSDPTLGEGLPLLSFEWRRTLWGRSFFLFGPGSWLRKSERWGKGCRALLHSTLFPSPIWFWGMLGASLRYGAPWLGSLGMLIPANVLQSTLGHRSASFWVWCHLYRWSLLRWMVVR